MPGDNESKNKKINKILASFDIPQFCQNVLSKATFLAKNAPSMEPNNVNMQKAVLKAELQKFLDDIVNEAGLTNVDDSGCKQIINAFEPFGNFFILQKDKNNNRLLIELEPKIFENIQSMSEEQKQQLLQQLPNQQRNTVNELIKEDNSGWEILFAAVIILLSLITVFVALNGVKKTAEEVRNEQKQSGAKTSESRDNKVNAELKDEKIELAKSSHLEEDSGVGNQTSIQFAEDINCSDPTKQAVNILANPEQPLTLVDKQTGKEIKLYGAEMSQGSIRGTSNLGDSVTTYNPAKYDIIDYTGKAVGNDTISLMNNITKMPLENNEIQYVGTTNAILTPSGSGMKIDYNTADGVSFGNSAVYDGTTVGTNVTNVLSHAQQQNPNNAFLNWFSVNNGKVSISEYKLDYDFKNETYIGDYNKTDSFYNSQVGDDNSLRQAINLEGQDYSGLKLAKINAEGQQEVVASNINKVNVNNGQIQVKTGSNIFNQGEQTFAINNNSKYVFVGKNGETIADMNAIQLADNIAIKDNSVFAKNLSTNISHNLGEDFSATFQIGDTSLSPISLNAGEIRDNYLLGNLYNNNDAFYHRTRFSEGWDNGYKEINNKTSNHNLNSLHPGQSYSVSYQ